MADEPLEYDCTECGLHVIAFGLSRAPLIPRCASGWRVWLEVRGSRQKPSSVGRWRAVLQAALNHGCAAHDVPAPRLPGVKGSSGTERAIYLPDDQRRRLLASYNPHASCPVLLLVYQGFRTQEALQLDWRWVDFTRRTIHLPSTETKASRGRTVTMHPRVDALLFGLWHVAGKPAIGRVFLSARGKPYADTRGRGDRSQGGNPLSQAHETLQVPKRRLKPYLGVQAITRRPSDAHARYGGARVGAATPAGPGHYASIGWRRFSRPRSLAIFGRSSSLKCQRPLS